MSDDARESNRQVRVGIPHVVVRDIDVAVYDYDRVGAECGVLSVGTVFQPWLPNESSREDVPITLGDQALEFDWGKTAWKGHYLSADDYFSSCRVKDANDTAEPPGFDLESNHNRIYRELVFLLHHHDESGSVVLVEEPKTERFIQFGPGTSLEMDVPDKTLNAKEFERARCFFANLGDGCLMEYDAPNSETGEVSHGATFNYDFGQDAKAAAKTAIAFFDQVYRVPPNVRLRVERLF